MSFLRRAGPRPVAALAAVIVSAAVAAGCGGDRPDGQTGARPSTDATSAAESGIEVVQGSFDVGGHSLFLTCSGSGSPTVIHLHAAISDKTLLPHVAANGITRLLAPDYRTCAYDRRNVGDSDTVDAVQLPNDPIEDLHRLLEVADVAPPYVLVGASLGGMFAYLYANEYPDEVVGMVLLDAVFPDELALEELFPPDERLEAFAAREEAALERISSFKVLVAGQPFIGHEPAIPVTYLASENQGREDNDYGIPEYNRRVLEAQATYVDRFSPGVLKRVDAPHLMEVVAREQIADEVRAVIAAAG